MRLSLRMKIMICCVGLVALLDLLVVVFVRSGLSDTLRARALAKGGNMAVNLAARSEHLALTEDFGSLLQLVGQSGHHAKQTHPLGNTDRCCGRFGRNITH